MFIDALSVVALIIAVILFLHMMGGFFVGGSHKYDENGERVEVSATEMLWMRVKSGLTFLSIVGTGIVLMGSFIFLVMRGARIINRLF